VRVLVVNAGSSSLKLSLLGERDEQLAVQELDAAASGLDAALHGSLGDAEAIGHRIVHGGGLYRDAVLVDARVRDQLEGLVELAPLHQPKSLAALDAVSRALPELPAVACFDTAFHATLPAPAATYALPEDWREQWGLRRYGFHGLSHAWVARRVPELLDRERESLRIVSCHLGAGASLCAIEGGRSVDTTMGFTPLEGLVMATRSGSVDPGLLLWLTQEGRLSQKQLADGLEHRSGLLGLGGSADMRELIERAEAGEQRAGLAVDVYVHRLCAGIGAMAAALGGLDVLAFTAGVGEHSAHIRSRAASKLGFLGVALDEACNQHARADAEVSSSTARVRTLVLAAREDVEIARQTRALLSGNEGSLV